MPRCPEPM